MQLGCLMKILEAEQWLKGTNFREPAFLQRQQDKSDAGAPHPRARKVEGRDTWSAKTWLPSKGVTLLLKATLPTCVLSRRGLSLLQHAPRSSPYDTGAGSHVSCKLAQDRRSQTAARGAHNSPAVTSIPPLSPGPAGERADRHAGGMQPHQGAHPFDFDASSMEAQAHTSCNRRAGYYVRETAPPLAPVPRLLDCGTGAATRGDPMQDPTVPTEHIGHGSVSRGRRRDGRYGQKWAGSNGGVRRAEAAVKSSTSSRPLLGQRGNPLPRCEDDAPVFRSSNGSRTHNGCPANHSSRRINSAAGQAAPLAGKVGDASPPPQ
jgi:hypothetical protein